MACLGMAEYDAAGSVRGPVRRPADQARAASPTSWPECAAGGVRRYLHQWRTQGDGGERRAPRPQEERQQRCSTNQVEQTVPSTASTPTTAACSVPLRPPSAACSRRWQRSCAHPGCPRHRCRPEHPAAHGLRAGDRQVEYWRHGPSVAWRADPDRPGGGAQLNPVLPERVDLQVTERNVTLTSVSRACMQASPRTMKAITGHLRATLPRAAGNEGRRRRSALRSS